MAPRIYRLFVPDTDYTPPPPPKARVGEVWNDSHYMMPHTPCPGCNGSAKGFGAVLPESRTLTPEHPLMKRVRAIWQAKVVPKWGRWTVGWDEYQELATAVRLALGLPPEQLLPPLTVLGPARFLVRSMPLAHVSSVSRHLLVSPAFADWLTTEGITGWEPEPTVLRFQCRRPPEQPEMLRLRVTGSAGRPANYDGDMLCPSCGGYTVPARRLMDECELNAEAWDGSDIFTFGCSEQTYVTERVRSAMLMAGFTTVGFAPSPPSAGPPPEPVQPSRPIDLGVAGRPVAGPGAVTPPAVERQPREGKPAAATWTPGEWVEAVKTRLSALSELEGCVDDVDVRTLPPLPTDELAQLAAKLGVQVPEVVARFWTDGSAGCVLGYEVESAPGVTYGTSVELLIASDVPVWLDGCRGWAQAADPVEQGYWANAFPIGAIGTGDMLAVDLRHGHVDPPVVYLCHDGPSQTIGPSLSVFLSTWLELCCIDPDIAALADYLDEDGYLSSATEAGQALRAALLDGSEMP